MTRDIETLVNWLRVVCVISSIATTAVPVLYFFSPWRTRLIGRLFMLQAISFAATIDIILLFSFWTPADVLVIFWVDVIVLTLVAVSTTSLVWAIWRANHSKKVDKHAAE